jgi:hypothetical protein
VRERPILIAYRRFEQLQELLFARGYPIDPGGRDPNEWRDDPPLGLVRLKGVALKGEGEEAEPDPRITFSIAEFWSAGRVEAGRLLLSRSGGRRIASLLLRPSAHSARQYPAGRASGVPAT